MWKELRHAVVMVIAFTILTGLAYPLAMTGIAQVIFPWQANGSLVERDGKVVGSALIGQVFADDKYFHGRPSATTDTDPNDATKTAPAPYNAQNSSGSNLGPTSKSLVDRVKAAVDKLKAESHKPIPVDLVTTSASGLDPEITPAAAAFQIPRVARARRWCRRRTWRPACRSPAPTGSVAACPRGSLAPKNRRRRIPRQWPPRSSDCRR